MTIKYYDAQPIDPRIIQATGGTPIPQEPKTVPETTDLTYGFAEKAVEKAVATEEITHLDLTGLPIQIAIKDINLYSNDEYTLLRRQGIGASEASIVLGVNPYSTRKELIAQKTNPTISAEERAIGEQIAVRKGVDLEPLILKKFEKYFKQNTIKPADMYRFTQYPYLTLNFDGVTGHPGAYVPAEIKVVTTKGERHYNPAKAMFDEVNSFKPILPDISAQNWPIEQKAAYYGIPPYYYTQLQVQIAALNAKFGYLSILMEKSWTFHSFLIWRDYKMFDAFIIEGWKVWEQIQMQKGV